MKRLAMLVGLCAAMPAVAAETARLPIEDLSAMAAGRARLGTLLDHGARTSFPEMTARAEIRFECWIRNPEAAAPGGSFAACREDFLRILAEIERLDAAAPRLVAH